jgi:hypothetical protein
VKSLHELIIYRLHFFVLPKYKMSLIQHLFSFLSYYLESARPSISWLHQTQAPS